MRKLVLAFVIFLMLSLLAFGQTAETHVDANGELGAVVEEGFMTIAEGLADMGGYHSLIASQSTDSAERLFSKHLVVQRFLEPYKFLFAFAFCERRERDTQKAYEKRCRWTATDFKKARSEIENMKQAIHDLSAVQKDISVGIPEAQPLADAVDKIKAGLQAMERALPN